MLLGKYVRFERRNEVVLIFHQSIIEIHYVFKYSAMILKAQNSY